MEGLAVILFLLIIAILPLEPLNRAFRWFGKLSECWSKSVSDCYHQLIERVKRSRRSKHRRRP